jgi:uncharacterized protein YkwD
LLHDPDRTDRTLLMHADAPIQPDPQDAAAAVASHPAARRRAARHRAGRRRAAVLLMVVATLAGVFTLAAAAPANAAVTGDWQTDLLNQVNAFRAANGRGPVKTCPNLDTSAQSFANDMAARGYFSHTSPEGSTYVTRNEAAGYTGWNALGENIAAGYASVAAVMAGWTTSPDHRANLLGGYADVGFGLAYAANGLPFWVNEFGNGGKCGTKVIGSFDSISSPGPQTATVAGWAVDTTGPAQVLNVDVYVDGGLQGRYAADQLRFDVAGAVAGAGAAHGFGITFTTSAGTHNVCIIAHSLTPGLSTNLGCRGISLASGDPIGSFDAVLSPGPGRLRVAGWAIDPESVAATSVHIYVDGRMQMGVTANSSRPDIGLAYQGYGANHGFDATFEATGGGHDVCVYAINVGVGSNRLLTCRWAAVVSGSPIGALDAVDLNGPRNVLVRGWTFDAESIFPIDVDIYVDGQKAGRYSANQTRNDLAGPFPGYGVAHGYSVPLLMAPGSHTVCTYGINVGAVGGNATLGCKVVTVPGNPIGSFDALTASGGTLRLAGWALDPDTQASIDVHVYVDGIKKAVTPANTPRADIGAAFPFFGAAHGYALSIPNVAAGNHTVCTYGINAGVGSNALIACRGVTA